MKAEKKKTGHNSQDGNVENSGNVVGRDFVGRDQKTSASSGGIVVGGNVIGSNIVLGNNNVIGDITNTFTPIYQAVEKSNLSPQDKDDLKAEIKNVENEVQKGDKADETILGRQLRNVQRMAPDILDVILATFASPAAGLGMVAKKIAERMKTEAKPAQP